MKKFMCFGVLCVALFFLVSIYGLGDFKFGLYRWNYKITVTVSTPEGEVSGSSVREMRASTRSFFIPQIGNPASITGEAVVIDLGERGVMFALISHESDNRFRDAFPLPGRSNGIGGSTDEGIKYHASLPIGTKGVLDPEEPPSYPKIVMFKDMDDPTSLTLVQEWARQDNGKYYLKENHMEALFGQGVSLKNIVLEITDESITLGFVDQYLPDQFKEVVIEGWRSLSNEEKEKLFNLTGFKKGIAYE